MNNKPQAVTCRDGKTFQRADAVLVGSVATVRGRDVHRPAVAGEYPVLVEQTGAFRMFTYSSRIERIEAGA